MSSMKKSLKFRKGLVAPIISGEKDTTWRIKDDKDLTVGDELDFINSDTKEKFGEAKILAIEEKKMGELTQEELAGHGHPNAEHMYQDFRKYYGPEIGPDTPVKIIKFEFKR